MVIRIYYNSVLDMSGIGEELLIDGVTGEVMARFYNGNFPVPLVIDPTQSEVQTLVMKEAA